MGFVPPEVSKANQGEEKKSTGFVPPEVKKKDVAGTSQTSPSTPSPSGQMPGFVQSQRLDVNAAPSISPSTPQPVSTKPAQLPQFIYNNNLNTGAKPSGRGDFGSTARSIEEGKYNQAQSPTSNIVGYNVWDQYAASGYDPNPAPIETEEKKIERQTARSNMYVDMLHTYKQQFDKIQLENAGVRANTPGTPEYQTQVAAQYPGVAIAPVTQEQNTLGKAREFSDWYLINSNPSLYNDLKNPVKYYSQEQEPSLIQSIITPGSAAVDDYTRSFALQTSRATYDTYSLNNYTKATNRSLEINKSFLDSTYGPQKLAYDSAYDTLMAWPKDPNGNYIANTPEEQTKWSETMNTYKLLMSDEGFVSAMQAVDKDHQDLAAADSAYKQVIRENPLFFIAQDQAKQRSAEEQARLSQLGPVFEWKAKNIDNPAAMAIVDAAIGFTYLPKAFGAGDEFGWTDDLYNKASIGKELMIVPSLPVEDSTVSKFVSSAVTMGIMIGTGYAAGAALGGSELALMAGQAAAGTVTTMEGYYRAGKEAGMSDSDAESYSIVSGLVQGMLEMVNPEAAFGASVTKKSASEYMRILAEGGTKSFARKEATKEIFRNIAAENVQELMQQMAEWGVNMKANQITGANLDVGEKWGKTIAETALITTLISGIVGGMNAASVPNRLGAEATYAAGLDPETYRSRTAAMVIDGTISQEKAAEINDKISIAEKIVSKIPSTISPEKAVELIPKIAQKIALEEQRDKSDESLKPAVEEQITAVSEEIRQTAGIKTEEEKVAESNQKLATEKEAADLEMLSTMGVITPEQQTRLDEIKSAMAPAETTGAETKTTSDATQERIVPENRQQQYQDAQEGGVPTETGGSNITEQVGQVQQEKVSSETTPVEEAAAAVQRSLSSAGINVRTLTEEEAVAEGYSDKTQGMFEDKKGQIVVVPSRIQEGWGTTVVWHEGAHPVVNIMRNTDKPTYDAMVRGMKNLAQNATGKNKAQLDDVVKFAEEYRADRGQEGVDDESVVELIGRVGSGMIDIDALPKSFKQKFVDFVNSMATKLGLGTVMNDTDTQTLINKAKEISDVLKSGRDIAEVVGAENVKKFKAGEGLSGQERAIEVFNGVLDDLGIKVGTVNEKTGKRKVTNFDVAKALNEYYKKSFAKIRVGDFGKKALDIVSGYATDEVLFAISKFGNKSGKGWYTVDFNEALNIMKAFDNNIADNQEIRDAATVAIAIASNSTDVYTNLTRIVYAIDTFKKTGRFPNDIGVGKGMSAISKSIDTYNKLLDVFGSVDELKKFMSVVRPISESKKALMEKVGAKSWTEVKSMGIATDPDWNENESLPTSIIMFGPKIGAFWSNLSGLGGTPTIDRWCIRTMYRYMGDMRAKVLPSELNDFMKTNSLEGQSKGSVISLIQDHSKMFNAIITGKGEYAGQTKEQRNEKLKPYRKGNEIWSKMSGVVSEIENGLTEKIENKAQYAKSFRSFTKNVFEDVQRKVKERTGESLEISDIQAILWIFEKELFGSIGVKQRPESTYSSSAQRLVNELNSGKFTIDQLKQGKITDVSSVVEEEGAMGDSYGLSAESFESGLKDQKDRISQDVTFVKGQESRGRRLFSEPVEDIANVSKSYKDRNGITTGPGEKITTVDVEEAKRRADAFEQMQNTPDDPQVKAAYQAMATETIDQFDELTKAGYAVEIYEGKGEPYANSQEMLDDLRNNKHLFVLSTEKDFGQNKITDKQRNDNPLLKDSGRKDINGKSLLTNDVFRFVHDAFGHGERGNSFGPIGEENAWDVHVRMYSPLAARAMTTETRGQNSWVNFGPHMRNEDGSIKSVPMKDRPFAEQKIGLLPERVSSMQESRGKRMDVVANTYVQSGLTEDGNDYVFFHVSSADEKSVRKGIDSRNFYSTRTSKSEKGTQYGVASFYTKPKDGERMVGGDKYVVRVSKDKVYPMDTDPKGYKDQVEKTVPENTPFRAEVIKKKMADLAAKDGYQMAVGEWYYSRTGEKTDMPEFRADALVALKPTNESASDFVSNEESGMERIAHPEETKYKDVAQYEALGEAAYDYLSEKGRYDDAYDIARDMYMYNKVPTEQEMKTLMKGMPKKISNMAPKTGQQSKGQRMNVAGVEYIELSIAAQETLRARRSKKSYFDDAVSKMPKSDFDKDEVERIIKEENFGIITGENPMGTPTVSSANSKLNDKAVKWLESRGYEAAPVTGKYGQTENSFFVPGLTVADAVEFSKAFNQDGVVTNEGMVYQDGRMSPRTMNDSFNVDSSSPTEDFVSAIRTEDGNVTGFKVGIDLETKVDSSYVAQSAVDTKSTEYAKSSVDKAISERADAKVQDDADTLSAINTTAEEAKSSSIINGPTKISQLKDQVVKAVEDGLISDATAKKVVDDAIKSYDEKVAASKTSIKESIDKIKDVISKFLFNPEGQYVTNPETGEKTKISKSSIFDVEATVNFATDAIKKAVDKGVDLAVALGNFKSALVNHPTIKNNIANNVITEGEFEAMLDAEIAKLIQANNLKNKTQNAKASKSLERTMASQHVSQEVKDSLQAQGLTYSPDTIAASVSDAQAIVEYFDAEGALDVLEENMANVAKSPDVVPHTRTLILAEIFDKRLKYSDSISNDPAVSDQAKKAASDKAANTAIAFSVINGQYAKSVSMASKRMKQIIGMSPKGLELFVDAQVKMKSEKFVKSNKMQRKIKKAIIKASQTGNAVDAKKAIMDSMMPDYAKLDDKFKTSIDGHISTAINSNGQIDKKALDKALASYYSGLQMNDKLKQAILDHTAAIKDMNEKEKNFSKIIEEYKNALSGLDPGTPAYKAVVAKYEKATIEAANATREADFKARLEGERLGRQIREGRDIWQSLASIMKLNMLTPQTIVVNVFGYLPAIMLRGAAVTIATPIDWAITSAMKAFRPNVSRTTNLLDIYGGIKYGAAYGVKEGFRKIKYGSTSEDVEKYNMKHSMNAFQAWRDLFAKKSPVELNNIENRVSAFIEGTFGMPADGMSRLLSIGDKIPFEIAKANKLTTLANETYVKNKDGTQRKMNNAEKLEFIFNPPAEAADIAEEFAQKMTYQQKNVMSDMVNRSQKDIASKISEGVSGAMGRHLSGFANLLVGTVVPFTKTPINLLTETFHFTNPAFGLAYSVGYAAKSVKAEKAGDNFKASYFRGESIRNFSRASVAMGVAMVAANMIKNGLMTGDEDEMKFDAKSMQYENVRARSLNISALMRMFSGQDDWSDFRQGDLTVNYSKMGTLGLGLSSWADFYRDKDDNQINSGIDELMSLSGLGGISLANVKSMIDQSFMTGIAGVIDAMRDDQGNKVKKFETNTAVALSRIFIPNTLSATSKASMDFTKETRTEGKDTEVGDMIMNRLRVDLGIMGTADELPSKITLWGEPVTSTPHGTNPWVYYMFDPVQSYSPDTETVGFKIQQMYFNTPKSMSNVRNKMIPSKPDQTITIGKQDVMLTGAEYENYQIAVGQKRKTLVSNYVGSDVWNASSVEVKAERLDYLYSYAAKIAKGEFIMNTPRLLKISSGTSYIPF